MKNEILKVRNEFEDLIMDAEKLYSIVFINWDSLASGTFSANNEVIIINCPGNLAYDPVVDACVPEAENDGKGLVCVIKKIKTGEIKFACDPKGEKDNCRTDSWGHELSCPNATIVIPN